MLTLRHCPLMARSRPSRCSAARRPQGRALARSPAAALAGRPRFGPSLALRAFVAVIDPPDPSSASPTGPHSLRRRSSGECFAEPPQLSSRFWRSQRPGPLDAGGRRSGSARPWVACGDRRTGVPVFACRETGMTGGGGQPGQRAGVGKPPTGLGRNQARRLKRVSQGMAQAGRRAAVRQCGWRTARRLPFICSWFVLDMAPGFGEA